MDFFAFEGGCYERRGLISRVFKGASKLEGHLGRHDRPEMDFLPSTGGGDGG